MKKVPGLELVGGSSSPGLWCELQLEQVGDGRSGDAGGVRGRREAGLSQGCLGSENLPSSFVSSRNSTDVWPLTPATWGSSEDGALSASASGQVSPRPSSNSSSSSGQ